MVKERNADRNHLRPNFTLYGRPRFRLKIRRTNVCMQIQPCLSRGTRRIFVPQIAEIDKFTILETFCKRSGIRLKTDPLVDHFRDTARTCRYERQSALDTLEYG